MAVFRADGRARGKTGDMGFPGFMKPGWVLWWEALLSVDPIWELAIGKLWLVQGLVLPGLIQTSGSVLCQPGVCMSLPALTAVGMGRTWSQPKCFYCWGLAATWKALIQFSIHFLNFASLTKAAFHYFNLALTRMYKIIILSHYMF